MRKNENDFLIYDPEKKNIETMLAKEKNTKLNKLVFAIGIPALIMALVIISSKLSDQSMSEKESKVTSTLELHNQKKADINRTIEKYDKSILNNKNLYFRSIDSGSYEFYQVSAIDEFLIKTDEAEIPSTAEFSITYGFSSRDISFFSQVIDGKEAIIVKPNYEKLVMKVDLENLITDYDFKNNSERLAYEAKVLEKISDVYKLSDNELNEKLQCFFKEHFFFIQDKYAIAIVNKQSGDNLNE